jgi:2'-deoxynucleoside 5'-phosphate N-hydrolase
MKIYLAIKFHSDFSNKEFIEDISSALEKAGHSSIVAVRDFEQWGALKFTNQQIMKQDFAAIRESDMLLVEFSEKGVGLGVATGFAKALGKKVIVIAKEGSDISDTIEGTADQIIFYTKVDDLVEVFRNF